MKPKQTIIPLGQYSHVQNEEVLGTEEFKMMDDEPGNVTENGEFPIYNSLICFGAIEILIITSFLSREFDSILIVTRNKPNIWKIRTMSATNGAIIRICSFSGNDFDGNQCLKKSLC